MSIVTIGIDPGLSGAIALLVDGEYGDVWDMPIEALRKGMQIDCFSLLLLSLEVKKRFIKNLRAHVVVEKVASMPRQGVSSTFRFGETFGCARMFAHSLGVPVSLVTASTWKREMNLTSKKDYSLSQARSAFPAAYEKLSRKKDSGRAEALLLALYAFKIKSSARGR